MLYFAVIPIYWKVLKIVDASTTLLQSIVLSKQQSIVLYNCPSTGTRRFAPWKKRVLKIALYLGAMLSFPGWEFVFTYLYICVLVYLCICVFVMNLCDDEGHKNPPKPEHLNHPMALQNHGPSWRREWNKKKVVTALVFFFLCSMKKCEKVGWDVVKYLVPVPFCSCGSILSVARYDLYARQCKIWLIWAQKNNVDMWVFSDIWSQLGSWGVAHVMHTCYGRPPAYLPF